MGRLTGTTGEKRLAGAKPRMDWLTRLISHKVDATGAEVPSDGIAHLENAVGYNFRDKTLLVSALKHRSYVHGNGDLGDAKPAQANERLEFLGDAVLGLVTTEYLYRQFPEKPEGELTKRKSVVVSKNALARCAIQVGLDQHLLLSPVEESAGGRKRRSILGDGFEALLGAMFLDGGLDPVRRLLERELLVHLADLSNEASFTNFKSLLLEHVQACGTKPPEYALVSQTGPDHEKTFTVDVRVGGKIVGQGTGPTKKHAQQEAARIAYDLLIADAPVCNGEPPEQTP